MRKLIKNNIKEILKQCWVAFVYIMAVIGLEDVLRLLFNS